MKSIIALSVHKAGSTIADRILLEFCKEKGFQIDRIATRVSASPLSERELFIDYQKYMSASGVYYGIARGPYVKDMPIISSLKTIIQVRDPRDCLTSAFFSLRESHVPPKDPTKLRKFEKLREDLRNLSINNYARNKIHQYKRRLSILGNILDRHNDVLLLRYEDMVCRTEAWLEEISKFIGQPLTAELRAKLSSKIDFYVDKEDASQHKRQVSPGDHLRKLSPETILEMNHIADVELRRFGYLADEDSQRASIRDD